MFFVAKRGKNMLNTRMLRISRFVVETLMSDLDSDSSATGGSVFFSRGFCAFNCVVWQNKLVWLCGMCECTYAHTTSKCCSFVCLVIYKAMHSCADRPPCGWMILGWESYLSKGDPGIPTSSQRMHSKFRCLKKTCLSSCSQSAASLEALQK